MNPAVGIVDLAFAAPSGRLATADVETVWQSGSAKRSGVHERAVLDPDADVITLAAEAARRLKLPSNIGAIFFGTQSSPDLSRSAAAVLADMLGIAPAVFATDVRFSGKSGTAALAMAIAWVRAGFSEYALAVGADALCLRAAPGDPLEITAGAGAACVLVGNTNIAARFEALASTASDAADGFRLEGDPYVRSGGAGFASSGIGDLQHMVGAWKLLLARLGDGANFAAVAAQQPDGRLTGRLARAAGIDAELFTGGSVAPMLGDLGAASPLAALLRQMEGRQPGDRVGLLSYGFGAGSDALSFIVERPIEAASFHQAIERRRSVDYPTAVRWEGRYRRHAHPLSVFE